MSTAPRKSTKENNALKKTPKPSITSREAVKLIKERQKAPKKSTSKKLISDRDNENAAPRKQPLASKARKIKDNKTTEALKAAIKERVMNPVHLPLKNKPLPVKTSKKPLQFKRGTAAAFFKDNPLLASGQPAVETDTYRLKIGDGVTKWRQLPYISKGDPGKTGKSAYELWIESGNKGNINDFLESLVGATGASAYELWLSVGNEGSLADFIINLQGDSAYQVWLNEGNTGTVTDFLNSFIGASAYEVWLSVGNEGTEEDFIESLKGASAYEIWIMNGNSGTEEDFLESLRGEQGKSIYDLYVECGGTLTEEEFLSTILCSGSWGTF